MTDFSAALLAADGSKHDLSGADGESLERRVGRSADCDITIDDPRVSRAHALLRVKQQSLSIEDLGSANGTQVNGRTISAETTLSDGDTVSFDKHNYVVILSGVSADMDATIVGGMDDATLVSIPEPEPKAMPEPVKEAPTAEPLKAQAPSDLPGSWTDSGTSDSTRVLSLDAIAESESGPVDMERASDLPHLILVATSGSGAEAVELQVGDGTKPDVWEIGRDPSCEVVVDEPSVSARHAQLIHDNGRWRLVNLVSANGIFVNGEKRLTAYLADGDEIRLGIASLIFRAAAGSVVAAAAKAASDQSAQLAAAGSNKGFSATLVLTVAILALAAAAAAYFLL